MTEICQGSMHFTRDKMQLLLLWDKYVYNTKYEVVCDTSPVTKLKRHTETRHHSAKPFDTVIHNGSLGLLVVRLTSTESSSAPQASFLFFNLKSHCLTHVSRNKN